MEDFSILAGEGSANHNSNSNSNNNYSNNNTNNKNFQTWRSSLTKLGINFRKGFNRSKHKNTYIYSNNAIRGAIQKELTFYIIFSK